MTGRKVGLDYIMCNLRMKPVNLKKEEDTAGFCHAPCMCPGEVTSRSENSPLFPDDASIVTRQEKAPQHQPPFPFPTSAVLGKKWGEFSHHPAASFSFLYLPLVLEENSP